MMRSIQVMCGVPFHSADTYVARLIEKGHKVAICEQVEDPKTAKGLVKREIIQIVTPGTVTSNTMLNEKENNYLASVYADEKGVGFSYCDISTGEINVTEFKGKQSAETLLNELVRIGAKEIIINQDASEVLDIEDMKNASGAYFTELNIQYYNKSTVRDDIFRQFRVKSLIGIGLDGLNHVKVRSKRTIC